MHFRSLVSLAVALVALAGVAGCGGDNAALAAEQDDSSYREGEQMKRQGRWDEALTAYLKVIDKRGDSAPESNLEAGVIYLNHIKDPIFAIYHFRRYLELEPNSKQAVFVRGQIDAAKREFARALPGQPMESLSDLGMGEQLARLQRDNDELRAENTALRAGANVPAVHSSSIDLTSIPSAQQIAADPTPVPEKVADTGVAPITLAPPEAGEPKAETTPAITDAPENEPAPAPVAPTRPTAAPAAQGRHHLVAHGDTLFSLSQKYYGTRSRWKDIFQANRNLLGSQNTPLKIGMDLKIP